MSLLSIERTTIKGTQSKTSFNDERVENGNEGEKDGMWLMGKDGSMGAEEEIRNWRMNRKRKENLIMESFPFRGRPL